MKRSLLFVLGAVSLGVVVVVIGLFFLVRHRPAPPPLPNPNGYDDFAAAGQWLVTTNGEPTKLPPEELRSLLKQNAKALEEVRSGLAKESAVPVMFNQTWLSTSLVHIKANKQIAQLLVGEGSLHLHDGKTNEAARSFTDCLLFADAAHRRGVMIHELVGIACRSLALQRLAPIASNLSPDTRKEILRTLVELDRDREPASAIVAREREWSRATYGSLRLILSQFYMRDSARKANERFATQHARSLASTRLLITELALQGHQAQHGKPPATLDELVPAWLPSVPIDPFTGKPFVYRTTSDGYLLYSVGPDGKDNGGTPGKRGITNNFDLLPGGL